LLGVPGIVPLRRTEMKKCWLLAFIVLVLGTCGFAQKVKVGYDKSTDFSRYKTYTWAKPETPVTRPLLYDTVVGTIDQELNSKGLERVETDGDLTLIAAGGIEYGSNLAAGTPILPVYGGPPPDLNATMWTGGNPSAVSAGPIVAQGTLVLEFVDRSQNKAIWSGAVRQNLDPEKKNKSLDLAAKAIVKLLKGFPPKGSKK
jgi:Domain of unknown function (DUF4136)